MNYVESKLAYFYEIEMRLEHQISRDSASPSSVENPENNSASDTSKGLKKLNNLINNNDYWIKNLQDEEEPKPEMLFDLKGIIIPPYPGIETEDMPINTSELFNISHDSGMNGHKQTDDITISDNISGYSMEQSSNTNKTKDYLFDYDSRLSDKSISELKSNFLTNPKAVYESVSSYAPSNFKDNVLGLDIDKYLAEVENEDDS